MTTKTLNKIIFVCLGNICRSPTGEAVLKKLVLDQGLSHHFHIESAGTAGYHIGERPDPRTRRHGERRGLKFESLAQQFSPSIHFTQFDYVICMDEQNLHNILRLEGSEQNRHKVFSMMSFVPNSKYKFVPDPYSGGPNDFELVLDLVEEACVGLLNHILKSQKT